MKIDHQFQSFSRSLLLLCGIFFLLPLRLHAVEPIVLSTETAPLVEVGLFGGAGWVPDYPGADQSHARWLALPFVIFRGKIVRTDDQSGVKARLLRRDRFDVDLGFAGAFPVHSSDNRARAGMPDLDWLGEVGPRATMVLARLPQRAAIKLLVPLRAVFSTNFHNLHDQGYTVEPTLSLELPNLWSKHWFGLIQVASNFGSRRINAYLYDVESMFATAQRQSYEARAGYMGSHVFIGLGTPKRYQLRFFSGMEYNVYEGAANLASPLFRSRTGVTVISGFTWVFYKSLCPGFE